MGTQIRRCLAIGFSETTKALLYLPLLPPILDLGKGSGYPQETKMVFKMSHLCVIKSLLLVWNPQFLRKNSYFGIKTLGSKLRLWIHIVALFLISEVVQAMEIVQNIQNVLQAKKIIWLKQKLKFIAFTICHDFRSGLCYMFWTWHNH